VHFFSQGDRCDKMEHSLRTPNRKLLWTGTPVHRCTQSTWLTQLRTAPVGGANTPRHGKTRYTAVTAPQYLSALLTLYTPMRHLRCSHAGLLAVTQTRLRTVGNRAFVSYAHRLWNALPPNIRDAQTQVF